MAQEEVAEFLTHLARDRNVAPATQNQALSALLFLYKEVLKHEIGWLENVERARKPSKLPVVLSHAEMKRVFAHLHGVPKLMAGFALRQWAALDGMCAASGQRYRLRADADHRARRKGREGSHYDVADKFGRTFAAPSRSDQSPARTRFGGWIWQRAFALCARPQISKSGARVGLAIR